MAVTVTAPLAYDRGVLSDDHLVGLYREMLYPRMIEEKMLILLRQGKVSKWFSGIGQEAISVGATLALDPDEMVFTLHRNLGGFHRAEHAVRPLVRAVAGQSQRIFQG